MTIKRLLLSSVCLLFLFNLQTLRAMHGETRARSREQSASGSLDVTLDKGLLQLKNGLGAVMTNMRLRLRFEGDAALTGEFEAAATPAKESDAAGTYYAAYYRLKPSAAASGPTQVKGVNAVLEVRRYLKTETVVAFLNYEGPALAARDGVQLIMGLDGFARGMATKRLKLYWTSPVFVSDHRLLSASNQLLLWRQVRGEDYHLLLPLAGGGMISEVGVSEIDYRYEFRVSASSYDPRFAPRRVPLFAYAESGDPYLLPRRTYETAFAASEQYGRLRWQKSYPQIFDWLGWCSWNAYGHEVTEEKILASARSLRDKAIPVGFMLVDDGWLRTKENRLTGFDADASKFPNALAGLAKSLREQYRIQHVGVWHAFQGYWSGVDEDSEIGRAHKLFKGLEGKSLPDPREGAGQSFYADWYRSLSEWGFDFVKVDGQGNNLKFTNGLMPLFNSGGGEHRNFQEAASRYFSDTRARGVGPTTDADAQTPGLNVINCMEMSLENVFNWRLSNVARNSDDYLPDNPQNAKEHVYQNAYNSYWTSNFAYPDWDMFQSHDPHAEFHAIARAVSGGPIYFTDEAGKEQPLMLRRLALSDGRLLRLDAPGQVTRDLLLADPALEPLPLKVYGTVTRPGLSAGMVAAFNVNKGARELAGSIGIADVWSNYGAGGEEAARDAGRAMAVYQRGLERVALLDQKNRSLPFSLSEFGYDLFTLAPVREGVAVFGLLDKYLGPAAVVSERLERNQLSVRLREGGEFGAWLERAPLSVRIDGRELPSSAYSYRQNLLRVPQASFPARGGEREITITLSR